MVNTFIQENKFSITEISTLQEIQQQSNCIQIENKIFNRLENKSKSEEANKTFEDTLFRFLNLMPFEELVNKEEYKRDEIIRLVRVNFEKGNRNLLIIEGHKQTGEKANLKSYELLIDDKCDNPFSNFTNKKSFSSDCFKFLKSTERNLEMTEWNQLKESIILTEFKYVNYSNPQAITICVGKSYSISYSSGSQIEGGIKRIRRDCPNVKTAIYMVADKLIKMKDGS